MAWLSMTLSEFEVNYASRTIFYALNFGVTELNLIKFLYKVQI